MKREFDLIIIRGAPGSGKSQTAKNLSKFFPKGVRLEVDAIRRMVISVDWTNQQEHIQMLDITTQLIKGFLKENYKPVIVVDTFSGDKVNRFIDTLYHLDKHLSIGLFGLYTTDDELKRRLALRTGDEFKDFFICKQLNSDTIKWKRDSEIQINTTGLTAFETASKIWEQYHQ